MQDTKTIKQHTALFDRMSAHANIDMVEAVLRSDVEPSELVDAVLKCTGCACLDTCEARLASRPDGSRPVPHYCRYVPDAQDLIRASASRGAEWPCGAVLWCS